MIADPSASKVPPGDDTSGCSSKYMLIHSDLLEFGTWVVLNRLYDP